MIEHIKMHDCERDRPSHEMLSDLDAGNLQLRLVQQHGAVILNSNKRFIRYRAGAIEHVFVFAQDKPQQRGIEGLGLFDPSLAGANQPSLF